VGGAVCPVVASAWGGAGGAAPAGCVAGYAEPHGAGYGWGNAYDAGAAAGPGGESATGSCGSGAELVTDATITAPAS
jgi:hypothetical protein